MGFITDMAYCSMNQVNFSLFLCFTEKKAKKKENRKKRKTERTKKHHVSPSVFLFCYFFVCVQVGVYAIRKISGNTIFPRHLNNIYIYIHIYT